MMKRHACVFVLLAGIAACNGGVSSSSSGAVTPKESPRPACLIGLPEKTRTECACNPLQATLEQRMTMSNINETAKLKVLECANGNIDLTIYKWDIAKSKAQGCISKETTLDDDIKKLLMKKVDEAESAAAPQLDPWKTCYAKSIGVTPS